MDLYKRTYKVSRSLGDMYWLERPKLTHGWEFSHDLTIMASALFDAIQTGRFRQVKFLLDNGVSIKTKNFQGQNLLVSCLHIGEPELRTKMFKFLLKRGVDCCDVDKKTGRDVLGWCCALDRDAETAALLQAAAGDINLNRFDHHGLTCLHHATKTGNTDLVQLLLNIFKKYHLSVDIADKEGLTPYLYAQRLGFYDIAAMLLEEGNASPEQFDTYFQHSADGWALAGLRERRRAARNNFMKNMASYKIRGKIPPIKKACMSQKLPSLQISTPETQSKISDTGAGTVLCTESETTERTNMMYPENQDDNQLIEHHHKPILTSKSLDTAFTLMSKIDKEKGSLVTEFVDSELDTTKIEDFGVGVVSNIGNLMTSLAEQKSSAFRQAAKPPTPPPPPKVEPKKKKGSTLAIIFGKDKKKSRSKKIKLNGKDTQNPKSKRNK